MNIFQRLFERSDVQAMRSDIQKMQTSLKTRDSQIQELQKIQAMLGQKVLRWSELEEVGETAYAGNKYTTAKLAIEEIDRKYNGTALWGVLQTGAIIDLRASYIISQGIKVKPKSGDKSEAADELAFCEALLRYNDLDKEITQEFAKEAEIEGRILLRLNYDEEPFEDFPGMINIRFVSWLSKKYNILTDLTDYLDYLKAVWTESSGEVKTLESPQFVYKKFGGRVAEPNNATPKIMKCLTQIERLDKALRDWREINRLFAAPIPYMKCETAEAVTKALEVYGNINYKIGKFMAGMGEFEYKSPSMEGVTSIEKEILTNAKMISGTTGIPVQFLGLPDLLSNRATADNLSDSIFIATLKERETWKGTYEEVITKAMLMWNEKVMAQKSEQAKLDPTKITVEIPYPSEQQWEHIRDVLWPMMLAGKLSEDTVLAQIPGIDVDAERESREEREANELGGVKEELNNLKKENINQGGEENA